MKYKSVTITPDLSGKKFNFRVHSVDGDREDYGETFNAMGFAYVYARRSDAESISLLRDHLINAAATRIQTLATDLELLLKVK